MIFYEYILEHSCFKNTFIWDKCLNSNMLLNVFIIQEHWHKHKMLWLKIYYSNAEVITILLIHPFMINHS